MVYVEMNLVNIIFEQVSPVWDALRERRRDQRQDVWSFYGEREQAATRFEREGTLAQHFLVRRHSRSVLTHVLAELG